MWTNKPYSRRFSTRDIFMFQILKVDTRNSVFVTNSMLLITFSLQPDGVNKSYFKL